MGHLNADEKGMSSIHTPGGTQTLSVTSRLGLIRLTMMSDKY